jgi:hypothetical protein
MSVVINEFELMPAQAPAPAQEQQSAEPPAGSVQLEVERALEHRRERLARLEAD